MIKLQKDEYNTVWHSELHIMKDGEYMGYVYKIKKSKEYPWSVVIPGVLQYPNNEFRTLKEARVAIKKALKGGDNV